MKNVLKRIFCFCAAIVCGIIFCILKILAFVLDESNMKKEEREPTLEEKMCGVKLPFSDEYYIPDEKPRK